jgi:hypothetical protein
LSSQSANLECADERDQSDTAGAGRSEYAGAFGSRRSGREHIVDEYDVHGRYIGCQGESPGHVSRARSGLQGRLRPRA